MKKIYLVFLIFIMLILSVTSCSQKMTPAQHDLRFTQVVKAFSAHLYRDYYRYSKRLRKDSKGGTVRDWPINHRVDDPHYSLKRKRIRKVNR